MKKFILSIFLILVLVSVSSAATYYVDWDAGTDNTTCGAISTPCKTPWYAASSRASSGDTWVVSAKDDTSPYNNGTNVVLEAPSGTTWQASPGETPKLSITSTFGDCSNSVPQFSLVVSLGGTGATISGFMIWGQLHINGNTNTIDNCDISGGVGARDDFISPIYIHGSGIGNEASGNIIRNTSIHDSCQNLTTSNNYCNGSPSDQCPLVMVYYDEDTLYENDLFYNPWGVGIRFKGYSLTPTVRYNFFKDFPSGHIALMGTDGTPAGPYTIYQNIMTGSGSIALSPKGGDNANEFIFYNNTIYLADLVSYWTDWIGVDYFNNISYTTRANTDAAYSQSDYGATKYSYGNYNDFYATGSGSYTWEFNDGTSTSLSAWNSRTTLEGNSITSDPSFLNASGNWNTPTDFKRSSYPTNGRGGGYPNVMGAYITGTETIGLLGGAPNPPINLIITPGNFIEPGVSIQ